MVTKNITALREAGQFVKARKSELFLLTITLGIQNSQCPDATTHNIRSSVVIEAMDPVPKKTALHTETNSFDQVKRTKAKITDTANTNATLRLVGACAGTL